MARQLAGQAIHSPPFPYFWPSSHKMSDRYNRRGVSAQKEDVHAATSALDKGLYSTAFCKVYPDFWGNDPEYCNLMHADGAGTKSSLAYLYWKETGDLSVWKGIATDAVVMNLDDLLCVGATGPFTYSSTIGRNKNLIPGEVLSAVINGTQECFDELAKYGIMVHFMGGETADVGDVVRTIIVDGTMACRMERKKLITNEKIQPGDVTVSFASYGKAIYESEYNSGIGSNGLTSARHEMLAKTYAAKYPESFDPNLPDDVVYNGNHLLTDAAPPAQNIGKMLLSPTRTYAPLVLRAIMECGHKIHGIIHCSGGGQTKCLHYLPAPMRVVKNNLLPTPPVFDLIRAAADTDWKEMYRVFNMGQRLEMFTDADTAKHLITLSASFGIDACLSGFVSESAQKELVIETSNGTFTY